MCSCSRIFVTTGLPWGHSFSKALQPSCSTLGSSRLFLLPPSGRPDHTLHPYPVLAQNWRREPGGGTGDSSLGGTQLSGWGGSLLGSREPPDHPCAPLLPDDHSGPGGEGLQWVLQLPLCFALHSALQEGGGVGTHLFKAGTLTSACEPTFHSETGNPWPGVQGTADGQGSLQELAGVARQLAHPPTPHRQDRGGPTVLLISRQLLSCCPRDESGRQQLLQNRDSSAGCRPLCLTRPPQQLLGFVGDLPCP